MNTKVATEKALLSGLLVLVVVGIVLSAGPYGVKSMSLMALGSDEAGARLYFAYGSNMNEKQMEERCPTARIHGLGQISGYKFIINTRGVASIVVSEGDSVEGVLWEISNDDESVLDRYEGVTGGFYFKENLIVEQVPSGQRIEALVYIASNKNFGEPRPGYLEKIVKAATSHGLSKAYLNELRRWQ